MRTGTKFMTSPIDPSILEQFKQESRQLLGELAAIVEQLEDAGNRFPAELLRDFAQKVDRVMGAAKTIQMMAPAVSGLERIGKLAELCKAVGYKAAEKPLPQLIPIFAAFWGETIEVMLDLLAHLGDDSKIAEISARTSAVLQKRLEWLTASVSSLTTTS